MKPTLLILAAGIGSRYGGLKQVDSMGPGGEAIMEYAVHDALRAGFGRIVIVIRRDIEAAFRELLGKKLEAHAEVSYAFQEHDTALDWLEALPQRQKPWGTGHAILAARDHIHEPFATINADDYYGEEAFRVLADFLSTVCAPDLYGMVAYRLGNTLSENGAVSRGVCAVDKQGFLTSVTERTKIERFPEGIAFVDESGGRHNLPDHTPVSMNLWGMHHSVMGVIEKGFRDFVQANSDNPKAEFYIPMVINDLVDQQVIRLKVLHSDSVWYGVTYPEDKASVQHALKGRSLSW
jgi:NDP-sugar pyrophosphorylase family protein